MSSSSAMPVTGSITWKLAALKKERIVVVLFFLSGASGLIFETICTRLLTYTFGNTAHAVSTVVSAFLGGLALGAFLIGRWADTRSAPLLLYGKLELLAGIYYLLIPRLFGLLTQAYVALCGRHPLGPAELLWARIGLSALVVLPPTILMGGTLPALASFIATNSRSIGSDINRLYSWNTLGAALGTLASTYLLIAYLGVPRSLALCTGINVLIFLLTIVVGSDRAPQEDVRPIEVAVPPTQATEPVRSFPGLLPVAAFLTGALGLAYEVVWTHVLAFWVGNTVYAFGLMLFVFLIGLGWGARLVARRWQEPAGWGFALAAAQLLLALTVMLTLPLWARIPAVFEHPAVGLAIGLGGLVAARVALLRREKRLNHSSQLRKALKVLYLLALLALILLIWRRDDTAIFLLQEAVRFLCAFYLLIAPALLLGMSLPLLINLYTLESRRTGAAVGRVYAANTLGAICGSLLAGFLVLPRLGSLVTLRAAATVNCALGVLFLMTLASPRTPRRTALAVVSALLVAACWLAPGSWDARRMSSGAYAYFQPFQVDDVLFLKEDIQGGLTTVVRQGPVNVLLSNGKFQGDNRGEVHAQIRFALIPMLFTHDFDNALVIGLGTGNTLRSVSRFPFHRIDVAELAPQIVEASRQWFQDVNGDVFDRDPRVRLHIADGRNFLLLSPRRFDLITAEISSIWISGEADLYNKEFYEICRAHLTDRGVLQQWVQIHHMRTQDLLVILNTAAQVFPHVAFIQGPHQGLLIASASPLTVDYRRLREFDSDAGIQQELRTIGVPSTASLLGELVLYGDSMRAALASPSLGTGATRVSTDLHPYLEYQTPKGNALSYNTVPVNLRFLAQYRPPLLPPELLLTSLTSEDQRDLIYGYVAQARGDLPGALRYFERVRGAEQKRAAVEIVRIRPATAK